MQRQLHHLHILHQLPHSLLWPLASVLWYWELRKSPVYWAGLPILEEQKASVDLVANCYAALELRSLPLPMDLSSAWTQLDQLDLLALFVFSNAVTVLDVAVNRLAPRGCLLLSSELVFFL